MAPFAITLEETRACDAGQKEFSNYHAKLCLPITTVQQLAKKFGVEAIIPRKK